jgi:hypothetical protein
MVFQRWPEKAHKQQARECAKVKKMVELKERR